MKHGARVSVVNLYTEELGNPEVPQKFRQARQKAAMPALDEKRSRAEAGLSLPPLIIAGCARLRRISAVPPLSVGRQSGREHLSYSRKEHRGASF